MVALPAHLAPGKRGQNGIAGIQSGYQVHHGNADLHRPSARAVIRLPGNAHQPAHGLDHEVIGGLLRARAGLTEARDGAVHETRILLAQLLIAQAQPLQRANLEVLQYDIGFTRHLADERLPARRFQIDRDRPFSPIADQVVAGFV
ncbi:hypothetical protein D3C85_1146490 [compost metagenome]